MIRYKTNNIPMERITNKQKQRINVSKHWEQIKHILALINHLYQAYYILLCAHKIFCTCYVWPRLSCKFNIYFYMIMRSREKSIYRTIHVRQCCHLHSHIVPKRPNILASNNVNVLERSMCVIFHLLFREICFPSNTNIISSGGCK